MRLFSKLVIVAFLFAPFLTSAQALHQDTQGVWRAQVVEATESEEVILDGLGFSSEKQTITARILEGEREGDEVVFENDYIQLKKGDRFYLNYLVTIQGSEIYSVREKDRAFEMYALFALFVLVVIFFGGKQGFRSLLSLVGSIFVVLYFLVPGLVSGYSPVLLSVLVAGGVLFFAIFVTHGFNRRSLIAFVGTFSAVVITGIIALVSIKTTGLTGFSTDESVYLNISTGGSLNFVGLLLAGVIIGSLGALDDIAVTQVAVVRELFAANKKINPKEVYERAMRVGKEHVGALVNTLVLAYTGASLPLLLLFSLSESSSLMIMNSEIFAAEIVRSLVGSIGLVLTVPITTLLAVMFLKNKDLKPLSDDHGHHHHHH